MDDFQPYRKLRCFVERPRNGTENTLKVYNPYGFDVPLDRLKYSVAYSNKYKQVKELVSLKVKAQLPHETLLRAKDTAFFNFQLPLPKMKNPVYFRVGISENGLPPGLNGIPIKINE